MRNGQGKRALREGFEADLQNWGEAALALIHERYHARVKLPGLVSVTLIGDAEIARVHGEFMDDPTPTDVITFPYGEEGEILISVETAERQASEFGASFEREVLLYLVHGLLHLGGFEDATAAGQGEMNDLQERLVEEVLGGQ